MSENQSRTRAEIQAEIEKLQKELETVPEREWNRGDKVWVEGVLPFKPCANEKYGARLDLMGVDHSTIDSGGAWFSESALIPAADLISREEHEAALAEAAPAKLDANTALKYLVKEYDLDTGHMDSARPRTYPFDHNGHVYEVVVRRKEPVVPMDNYDAQGNYTGSVAVAPESLNIIKWLRDYEESLRYENKQCLADQVRKCWQGITELPEPSEGYSEWAKRNVLNQGWTENELKQIAAALLAKVESAHD